MKCASKGTIECKLSPTTAVTISPCLTCLFPAYRCLNDSICAHHSYSVMITNKSFFHISMQNMQIIIF